MKIRADFVTNSSSVNYSVLIMVETNDNRIIKFTERTGDSYDEMAMLEFGGDLEYIMADKAKVKEEYLNVANLANYLMDRVYYNADLDEKYLRKDNVARRLKIKKMQFIDSLTLNAKSFSDISRISTMTRREGWGEYQEYHDLLDKQLCMLAKAVANTSGAEQEEAIREMRNYVVTPSCERDHGEAIAFADASTEIRYNWGGCDEDLIEEARFITTLREHISSGAIEVHQELDLVDGAYSTHMEYVL